jgi:putative nucleotidyltransferase-like protein
LTSRSAADPAFRVEHRRLTDTATVEIVHALESSSVPAILLKGPSIARWLYEDAEERHYWDIDLLVPPAELTRAESVTAGLGFEPLASEPTRIDRESHHERWYRSRDNVCVELHRGFHGVQAPDAELWDELTHDTEPLPLGVEGEVRVPAPAARTLLVGLHAATAAPKQTPLEDLRRAVRQVPVETWKESAALARRLRAEPVFAAGLALVPEGADLAVRLGLTGTPSPEQLLWSSPPTAMGFERLARTPGFGAKVRYIARELAPPPELLRQLDPLARRGAAGVVAAYVRRPFRLAVQAPRGFLAWRSARRTAR